VHVVWLCFIVVRPASKALQKIAGTMQEHKNCRWRD
jgi:hypothetical protein